MDQHSIALVVMIMVFLYLGYLALRRIPSDDPIGSGKRNAIAALIAFVDVPIVHFSVEWWRTLHQMPSSPSTIDPIYVGAQIVSVPMAVPIARGRQSRPCSTNS